MASLGDSVGTLVSKNGSFVQVSEEHTPATRQDECQRILRSHGSIFANKVAGKVAVTRAFGNPELKPFIVAEPECREIPLAPCHDLLILSTDGLYRSRTQAEVVHRVRELRRASFSLKQISEKILEECVADFGRASYDNLTLLIVDVAAYFADMQRNGSPVRSAFSQSQMRLRQCVSQAGHSESVWVADEASSFALIQNSEVD